MQFTNNLDRLLLKPASIMGSGQYINKVMDSIEDRTSAKAAMPEEMVEHQLLFRGGVDLPGVLQFEW